MIMVYPGKLIVVEGIDGGGKSSQIALAHCWLQTQNKRVSCTKWNSSTLIKDVIKEGKKRDLLSPTTFSLLHAVDFADRLTYDIEPLLKSGVIILADRYIYTALARDVARGVDPQWVRDVYSIAPKPDLILYFRIPLETALNRLLVNRHKLGYYESGMDLNLSTDIITSFRLFQERILTIYEDLVKEFSMVEIDASQDIYTQQQKVRQEINRIL